MERKLRLPQTTPPRALRRVQALRLPQPARWGRPPGHIFIRTIVQLLNYDAFDVVNIARIATLAEPAHHRANSPQGGRTSFY